MTDFVEVQDNILERIKTMGAVNLFTVFEGAIPSGDELVQTNGRYWPYVVVGFGGKTEATRRMDGITGSADNIKWTALVLYCVTDTAGSMRRLKNLLRDEFEGDIPDPTWGEFTEILTGDFNISRPDPDLIPLRFGETLAFKALTNA